MSLGFKMLVDTRKSSRRVMAATHPHLLPRLRMSGVVPLLPPYAFMACTVTSRFYLFSKWYWSQVSEE